MAKDSWDEEEEDSTPPTSPPQIARRGKFDDEEEDSDVLESWDAADDSDAEREKAKKAAEAKAKADAEALANKKSKAQRIEERRNERVRQLALGEEESSDEDEATKKARARIQEKNGDLAHAEDLFGSIGISNNRSASKTVNVVDPNDANNIIDLSKLRLFNPETKNQFTNLNDTIAPLIAANTKKGNYVLFLKEFVKGICKDLPSDQVKQISTVLGTLSNEKMKEEKLAEKGGKKTKAAKTKISLAATRNISSKADTTAYDDGLDDDDFM